MGLTPDDGRTRLGGWSAPAVLAAGLLVLAFVFVRPAPDRGPFELGLTYPVLRYEQLIALVGLGFAMAQMPARWLTLNAILFAAAIPFGGFVASWVGMALTAGINVVPYLLLLAPAGCVMSGLALVSPTPLRVWVLPPAALVSGVALGLVLNFDDPMIAEWMFAGGTILSGAWLVAASLLIWRRFEQAWFRIAGRIFGSWLVAIGAMLGALTFVPH